MNDLVVGLGQPFPQLIQSNAQDTYSTGGQESEMSKNPSHHQYITAAVGFFAYAQLFLITRHLVGPEAAIISALPVVLLGWGLGMKGGFLGGLTIVTVNTVLLNFTGAGREFLWDSAYMEGSVVLLVVGAAVGRLKEVRDLMISNRMSLEEEVAEARDIAIELNIHKASFNSLVEKNSTGILIVDQDGMVRFANHAASSQLRRDPHSLIGQPLGIPLFAGDVIEIEITRKNEEPGMAEMRMDETQWEGQTAYLLPLGDITDRKQVEECLREIDRMKSEFIDTISHELRTPLHSIKGFNRLILDGLVSEPEVQREFQNTIDQETDRLSQLIDDLLDVSRLNSGHFDIQKTPISIEGVIHSAIQSLYASAEKGNIGIKVDMQADFPWVEADEARINQVLVNLLSNAVKFSPPSTEITVGAYIGIDEIRIQVTDQGVGISEEAKPHIFERFYRADSSLTRSTVGTGLGLYISKQLIEAHDGRIWVESAINKGSTFVFTLPLANERS